MLDGPLTSHPAPASTFTLRSAGTLNGAWFISDGFRPEAFGKV